MSTSLHTLTIPPASAPPKTAAPKPPGPIEYTRTRSVAVDRAFLRRQRLIAGLEPCAYVDACKVLRTRVARKLSEHGWNTLAVTSPGPGAGTSLVAANLALGLALEATRTVLLVDANLRSPSLHRRFGIEPEYGLADHLLDGVPVEKLLLNPRGIERFVLLPGHRPLPGSAELLSSPRMADLLHELKHRYPDRIVILDLPPTETADALALAPLADALLLVAGAGRTGRDALAAALDHLQGLPVLGTVLNDAESVEER
jgi:protein-tyrosine kinase